MDRRSRRRRRLAFVLLSLFILVAIGLAVAASTPEGRAVGNVLEYKLRKAWWAQVGVPAIDPMHLGSLSGVVLDEQGKPLAEAVVVVSTVRGEVFQARSDAPGPVSHRGRCRRAATCPWPARGGMRRSTAAPCG